MELFFKRDEIKHDLRSNMTGASVTGCEQMTPASSEWPQLCSVHPPWEHSISVLSNPKHSRLSRRMGPSPTENSAAANTARTADGKPS